VLTTVEFHDQASFTTEEIADEWPNCHLAAELEPRQSAMAQAAPQPLLCFRGVVSQLLGALRLSRAELRHDSVMPVAIFLGKHEEKLIHRSRIG
jgi:hypothetical protein